VSGTLFRVFVSDSRIYTSMESSVSNRFRMVIGDETAVYHVMSRTARDDFPLGDIEKGFLLDLIKRYSTLYFIEILGFCIMGNTSIFWLECFPDTNLLMRIYKNAILNFKEFPLIIPQPIEVAEHLSIRVYPALWKLPAQTDYHGENCPTVWLH